MLDKRGSGNVGGRRHRGSSKSKKDSKEQRLRRKARQHVISAASRDRPSLAIGSIAMIASSYCVQGTWDCSSWQKQISFVAIVCFCKFWNDLLNVDGLPTKRDV